MKKSKQILYQAIFLFTVNFFLESHASVEQQQKKKTNSWRALSSPSSFSTRILLQFAAVPISLSTSLVEPQKPRPRFEEVKF